MSAHWDQDETHVVLRPCFPLPTCVLEGAGGPRLFRSSPVRLGKDPSNDFILVDPTCSRFHALIQQTASGYLIRDLGSRNGVFVGGVRVVEAWLETGVRVRLGEETLLFRAESESVVPDVSSRVRLGGLVGHSESMRRVFGVIERVAPTDLAVLVLGETGTGKEVVARTIHELSSRRTGPFAVVDCSTLPESLVESELFGHEKGAFTGALTARCGLFEEADGGTLFLDEIGELPLAMQPKLLRVLERGEFRRVGGTRQYHANVRLIAATNRDLNGEVVAGRFRKDLLFRLNTVAVRLPPLRHRLEDLELLVHDLLERVWRRRGSGVRVGVTEEFLRELRSCSFPGNVRELANLLEREAALCQGHLLTHLQYRPEEWLDGECDEGEGPAERANEEERSVRGSSSWVDGMSSREGERAGVPRYREAKESMLAEFHRRYLVELMRACEGSVSAASRVSGMERKQIRALLRELGVSGRKPVD